MGQILEFSQENERRQRINHTIDELLEERQEVLVSFCSLAGLSSFDQRGEEEHQVKPGELQSFCQILVDYTALGHFEVYQRIIEGKERRVAVKRVADEVYPAIAETTDHLIDFNDKYDSLDDDDFSQLARDLSRVGEVLAIRGELEDKILAAMRPS
ncbi:MAG: Rsd/AlgQ family anti-sigma factor [Pseudomonadota bacterium]